MICHIKRTSISILGPFWLFFFADATLRRQCVCESVMSMGVKTILMSYVSVCEIVCMYVYGGEVEEAGTIFVYTKRKKERRKERK